MTHQKYLQKGHHTRHPKPCTGSLSLVGRIIWRLTVETDHPGGGECPGVLGALQPGIGEAQLPLSFLLLVPRIMSLSGPFPRTTTQTAVCSVSQRETGEGRNAPLHTLHRRSNIITPLPLPLATSVNRTYVNLRITAPTSKCFQILFCHTL